MPRFGPVLFRVFSAMFHQRFDSVQKINEVIFISSSFNVRIHSVFSSSRTTSVTVEKNDEMENEFNHAEHREKHRHSIRISVDQR